MSDQVALAIRIAVAVIAMVPFVVFLLSYHRTKMTRLLFAASGFGMFVVKEVMLAAGIFTIVIKARNPHAPEATVSSELALLEAALDLAIIALFILALLWKQGASVDGEARAADKKDDL